MTQAMKNIHSLVLALLIAAMSMFSTAREVSLHEADIASRNWLNAHGYERVPVQATHNRSLIKYA